MIAYRDYTNLTGFPQGNLSQHHTDHIVPQRHIQLQPPRFDRVLDRRLKYLLGSEFNIEAYAGPFKVDAETQKRACEVLLRSIVEKPQTLLFLEKWCNYSTRDLLLTIQRIAKFGGLDGLTSSLLLGKSIPITIDVVIMALGIGQDYIWNPGRRLFNPYSLVVANSPMDHLVGIRLLQHLDQGGDLIAAKIVVDRMVKWGYSRRAIEDQLRAMVNKDLLWTTTGSPDDFDIEASKVRLSHRGTLYNSLLLERSVFNYIVSFGVAKDGGAPLAMVDETEVQSFAHLEEEFDLSALAKRLCLLVSFLCEAEEDELYRLKSTQLLTDFRQHVRFRSMPSLILDGFSRLVTKVDSSRATQEMGRPVATGMGRPIREKDWDGRREVAALHDIARKHTKQWTTSN